VPRIVSDDHPAVDYFKTEWPSSGEVWLANGKAPHPNRPFRTPAIAETYKRILAEAEAAGSDRIRQIEAARRAFYKGFVAEAIDRFYQTELMDSTGARHRGLLTGDDLAHYAARVEKPLSVDYHGSRCTSSGRGRRDRCCCRPCGCSSASTSPRWTRSGRTSCTRSSRR
jgi:gamma-glutamyltranspeptidase/glutathione hydrolase